MTVLCLTYIIYTPKFTHSQKGVGFWKYLGNSDSAGQQKKTPRQSPVHQPPPIVLLSSRLSWLASWGRQLLTPGVGFASRAAVKPGASEDTCRSGDLKYNSGELKNKSGELQNKFWGRKLG